MRLRLIWDNYFLHTHLAGSVWWCNISIVNMKKKSLYMEYNCLLYMEIADTFTFMWLLVIFVLCVYVDSVCFGFNRKTIRSLKLSTFQTCILMHLKLYLVLTESGIKSVLINTVVYIMWVIHMFLYLAYIFTFWSKSIKIEWCDCDLCIDFYWLVPQKQDMGNLFPVMPLFYFMLKIY